MPAQGGQGGLLSNVAGDGGTTTAGDAGCSAGAPSNARPGGAPALSGNGGASPGGRAGALAWAGAAISAGNLGSGGDQGGVAPQGGAGISGVAGTPGGAGTAGDPAGAGTTGIAGISGARALPAGGTSASAGAGGAGGAAGEERIILPHVEIIDEPFAQDLGDFTSYNPDVDIRFVAGAGGCEHALSVWVPDTPADPWDYQMGHPIVQNFRAGDLLYLQFWARSPDERQLGLVWELDGEPYDKFWETTVPLTSGWTLYQLRIESPQDMVDQRTALRIRFGYGTGVYEIACLTLANYGQDPDLSRLPETDLTFGGHTWDGAAWETEVAERILQNRTGECRVQVVDAEGNPLPGATVHVSQQRHAFTFGTAARSATFLTNATYQETILRYFNQITIENDLKWPEWEDLDKREAALDAIELATANGLTVKGHTLFWPAHVPSRVLELDPSELPQAIRTHVEEVLTHEGIQNRVIDWDVVNEPYSPVRTVDELGGSELLATAFSAAREWGDPGASLFLNDLGVTIESLAQEVQDDATYRAARLLIDQAVDFDGVGLQCHLQAPYVTPYRLREILDEYATLGKRLQITELDVQESDPQLQAQVLRMALQAAFAHPAIDGITLWGFWAGAHWRGYNAALFDFDWTPKESGDVLEELLRNEWWTDALCETDESGECTVRAFLGDHAVEVEHAGFTGQATVSLDQAGGAATVTVAVPAN